MVKWQAASIVAGVALFGAFLGGCSGGNSVESPKAGDKTLRIAVIPTGSTHEFWKSVQAGADEAGKELGVEVVWKGPMKEDDREDQIKVVEDFTE